jgi:hypothetical protein
LLFIGALAPAETLGMTDTPAPPVQGDASAATPASAAEAMGAPTGTDAPVEATATPEGTISPEPTQTPEQSSPPEDTQTAAPTETPVAEDTPPVCTVEGCPHITYDENGNPVALCPLGEWMLAHGVGIHTKATTALASPLFAAPAPGAFSLIEGTTTLYRSGTYILSGGSALSTVIVRDNLAVALVLRGATIGSLTVGAGVSMEIDFSGQSEIDSMHAGSGQITLDGTGHLTVGAMVDLGTANLTMLGGSIALPAGAQSRNGRVCFVCDAGGATSATLDGDSFPFTTPDAGGQAHLWLPPLGGGNSYRSAVSGGVLAVRSSEPDPSVTGSFDMDGADDFVAVANQSTSIISSGGAPRSHTLRVDQSGVSLVFSNILLGGAAQIALDTAARIHVNGACSMGDISGTSAASVTGSGTLTADAVTLPTLRCASGVRLVYGSAGGGWQAGWQQLTSPIAPATATALRYSGKNVAMAYAASAAATLYAPLPTPAAGMRYDVRAEGTVLTVMQIPEGTQTLVLTDAGLTITSDGNYVIVSDGATAGSITVADGVHANVQLRGVSARGALALGAGVAITLDLNGSNRLTGGISVASGATLKVQGVGALLSGAVSGAGSKKITVAAGTNLSLASGGSLGTSTLKPTLIRVTDTTFSALADTAVTLRIGTDKPFATTTSAGGMVTLWGSRARTNAAVVVLSRANTYAEILTGTTANPDALPEINAVQSHTPGYVTFQVTGAQTAGIQAYVNRGSLAMPDTFVPDALQVPRLYGECNVPGLRAGDEVTYRAYAARQAGQALSAGTADAFQFSEQYTFTVGTPRKIYTLSNQSKEFDQNPFSFRSGLIPEGATVTYYKGDVALHSAPTDVGTYTAVVVIPAGHAEYMPTSVSVTVTIKRKVVLIQPAPAFKIKGTPDPVFTYTYTGTFAFDTVSGPLGRESGEHYGNYPYHTRWLVAADYYELVIDPSYPMFFIDWGPGHYIRVDPLSIIDPVHQVLTFSDGKKLDLILRTGNRLNISGAGYGEIVFDTDDRRVRPFTPQLRLKRGYDEAMILIEAEPEINDDGGYATDADGRLLLSPRTLSLSAAQLSRFKAQRITALGFRLQGVLCAVELAQLQSDAVRAAMADAGMHMTGARYRITLRPVQSVSDLATYPEDVQIDKALGAVMMHVSIEVQSGGQTLDIAWLISSARTAFDASALLADAALATPEIAEITVGRTQGDAPQEDALTTDTMELVQRIMREKLNALGVRLNCYEGGIQPLDSQLVVPYTASETEALAYTAMMQTSPFLMARHLRNGLYGLAASVAP